MLISSHPAADVYRGHQRGQSIEDAPSDAANM
jgi:hypothetical protein